MLKLFIILFTLMLSACSSVNNFEQSIYNTKKEFLLKNKDYRSLLTFTKMYMKNKVIDKKELSLDLSRAYFLNEQYDFSLKELLNNFDINDCDSDVITIATDIYKKTANNAGFKKIIKVCPLDGLSIQTKINIASYYIVNNKLKLAKGILLPIVITENLDTKTYPLLAMIYYREGDKSRALSLLYSVPQSEFVNNLIDYIGKGL